MSFVQDKSAGGKKKQPKPIFCWTKRQYVYVSDLAILFSHLQLSIIHPLPFKINGSFWFCKDLFLYLVSSRERHL